MRIAIACLVMLSPLWAFAYAQPKDQYIKCNCHITPGISGALPLPVAVHKRVHHRSSKAKPSEPLKPLPAKSEIAPEASKPDDYEHVVAKPIPGREDIITTNKLALPPGKAVYAPGELVYISGRVLDMHCVPVSDAVVEITQADPRGRFVKASLAERLSPDPLFTGIGRATTDNLGRFNFVTVYPGVIGSRAPFIHVQVRHKQLPGLTTEMFFSDDVRNASDPVYSRLDSAKRSMVTAKVWQRDVNDPAKGLAASWDISLNGKNPYRRF